MHAYPPFDTQAFFWTLVLIQVVGLASAWLARLSVGCRGQRPCQWLFLACLALVGGSTVLSMGVSAAAWLLSAGTLALMVLGAVCDFRREPQGEIA